MTKTLVVETPNQEMVEIPWNQVARTLYDFTADEIERLDEDGAVVWRGSIAFCLYEDE